MNFLLDTKAASKYLGVSPSFLEKDSVGAARIPFVRLGKSRAIRYLPEDLDRYIRMNMHTSTSNYIKED